MSPRPPATPPVIPGFTYIRHLGSGGFADVYLYEESLLRRQVAVKVLLAGELMAAALENFTNEANLMAQLSNHPSIVSVYQAGVSDDGRPFIVMEYCPRPNLQVRYRSARFSEAETLRIGIQIAGAVAAAHRAGILHRDIKPANILVTEYGRPALTDFGIAATTSSGTQAGLSVPWAPPELMAAGGIGDERSDVYSLAATLYTLLAGRTPFEIPGASNSSVEVMGRIQTMALPAIGRPDVSASLGRVLANAMAKNPGDRYGSALEFARALQRLQIELGMQPTAVDVVDDATDAPEVDDDDGHTRIRSIRTIEAQAALTDTGNPPRSTIPTTPLPDTGMTHRVVRPAPLPVPEPPTLDDTRLRAHGPSLASEEPPADTTTPPAPPVTKRLIVPVLGAAVLLVALLVTLGVMTGGQTSDARPRPTISTEPIDPAPRITPVPQVAALKGTIKNDRATFVWTNPDPQDGDSYLWRRVEPGVKHSYANVTIAKVALDASKSGSTCIEVVLRRANGRSAEEPTAGCAS